MTHFSDGIGVLLKDEYSNSSCFTFLLEIMCNGYSMEASQGASNLYPQHTFSWSTVEPV